MPNFSSISDSVKSSISNVNLKPNWKGLGKSILVIAVTVGVAIIAAVFAGILLAVGGNASIANFQINFDPNITIAYLMVNFFISRYHELTKSQSHKFFLLSLILSFTVTFIQGALLLVILPATLKKLRLMESS